MEIYTSCLIGKHGQVEIFNDFMESIGYPKLLPDGCMATEDLYFDNKVLISVLKKFVIPKLDQSVTVKEYDMISSGNRIRVSSINGKECGLHEDDFEDHYSVLSPEVIYVNDQDFVNEIILFANSYGDIQLEVYRLENKSL